MIAIKINDNSVPDDFKDTLLVRRRDVLGLIDEEIPNWITTIKDYQTWIEASIKG